MNVNTPGLTRNKKLKWGLCSLPLALMLVAGCVPSLNALLTEEDLVFEEALLGTWGEKNEHWTFTKDGEKAYLLTITEKDHKPGVFHAGLGKLDGHLFLNIFPEETPMQEMDRVDFYKFHYVPAHTFMRVWKIGDELQLSMLDYDWLEKLLKEDPTAIQHSRTGADGDGLVITAPTEELQKFFIKHANNKEAFSSDSKLERVK